MVSHDIMKHFSYKDLPLFPYLKFNKLLKDSNKDTKDMLNHAKAWYDKAVQLNTELYQLEFELITLRAEKNLMLSLINKHMIGE